MTMFDEADAFLARAYPGSKLAKSNPFLDFEITNYRKLVLGKEQPVANELLKESCWLITIGPDPRPFLSAVDKIEHRAVYYEHDQGKREDGVEWVAKIHGRVDLEMIRNKAGLGVTLLIAPASERMIDQAHGSFYASSAADLARAVAAHPDSFLSTDYK